MACVTDRKACRQLRLYYGIYPVMAEYTQDSQKLRSQTVELAIKSGIVKKDDLAVIVTGSVAGNNTITDSMQIAHI